MAEENRIENLKKLLNIGIMSSKAKVETKKLIAALKERNQDKILKISWNLHQNISSSMKGISETTKKLYELREDENYNKKKTGTSVYHEADLIAHGDYHY